MRSMTGYGKAVYEGYNYYLDFEIKSVNSRFLEIRMLLPRELSFLEMELSSKIKNTVSRGKISAKLNYISFEPPELVINESVLRSYYEVYKKIKEVTGISEEISLNRFLENEEIIINNEDKSDNSELIEKIKLTLANCLQRHQDSSLQEGKSMKKFLEESSNTIEQSLSYIESKFPQYKEKMNKKLHKTACNVYQNLTDDELNRIALELTFYVEKSDVNEEILRLKHHLNKYRQTIIKEGDKGKTLNFILQEMHREINTIGSKFNENDVFSHIIIIKEEIEKCRELVQNIV